MSGYICRFYDEGAKILKMIYIKNNKEKYERKIMENDTGGVIR